MIDGRGGMKPGMRIGLELLAAISLPFTRCCDFETCGSEIGDFGAATWSSGDRTEEFRESLELQLRDLDELSHN
jgi:hypothetical protein